MPLLTRTQIRTVTIACALLAPGCAVAEPGSEAVEIAYLANEGFLIASGDSAVLIDALFGDGLSGYPTVAAAVRHQLETAAGRFATVDCLLVTHEHADHFDPRAVASFLARSPIGFVSTPAVVEALEPLLPPDHRPATRALAPAGGSSTAVDCGGLQVTALALHHGRLPVRNLGFVIELGNLRVLHTGDTEVTRDELRPFGLSRLGIDVALLPSWYLIGSPWLPAVAEIAPRQLVVMHLPSPDAPPSWFEPAASFDELIARIREAFPAAWVPTTTLETRTYDGHRAPSQPAATIPAGR